MATLADFFDGKVDKQEYCTPLIKEGGRTLIGKFYSEKFTFTGVPTSLAFASTSVSVTDIDGTSYIVPMEPTFRDGSSGYGIFPEYQVKVSRRRMSYHLWVIEVEVINGEIT